MITITGNNLKEVKHQLRQVDKTEEKYNKHGIRCLLVDEKEIKIAIPKSFMKVNITLVYE